MDHQDNNNNNNMSDNLNNLDHILSSRKRKSINLNYFHTPLSNPRKPNSSTSPPLSENDMNNLDLNLNLSLGPPPPPLNTNFYIPETSAPPPPPPPRPPRIRRAQSQKAKEAKSETIPPPYPWAANQRAKIHSLDHLLSHQIHIITGEVQCKKCERKYEIGFNLKEKFVEVGKFIMENRSGMHDRAPSCWSNPILPTCRICEAENSLKPVISDKKRSINWLFLLLGQMLGCCTLQHLKYFCKHTSNHRTGAKDRVLYLAYLSMCKQLDPQGPFSP